MNRYERARFAAGLNITAAARKAKVGRNTLSRIENDHTETPTAEVVAALAKAYKVDVEYLLGLSDEPRADEKAAA